MTWLGTTISTIRTPPTLPWGKTSVYFVFPLPWEMFYISLNSEICKLWTCFFSAKFTSLTPEWMRKMKARSLSISYFALKTATLFFIRGTLACLASTAVSLKRDAHQSFPFPPPKVIPAHPWPRAWVAFHHPSTITAAATSHSYTRSWRRQSWGSSSLSCEFSPHNPAFSLMVSLIRTKHLF